MKNYILYNNLSGNGKSQENAEKISSSLSGESFIMSVSEVDYKKLSESVTKDDSIVICGGDGTLNRFINDIEGYSINCNILYYPSGSGNDFLKDIEKTPEECPFKINQYVENLPSVVVKGKTYRFLNNVGFGIDGYCCEVGDELRKKSTKAVNYTSVAIKGLLFHYDPTDATVIVDGKEYSYKKVWIAPTMNGRYYGGGMMAAPNQDRLSGILSVMIFYGGGRLKTLMAFPSIFKGEHVKKTNMVKIHTGKEITVKFKEPRQVQIDGETILDVSEYTAKI